jgi:uncharacterized membrane protein (TIGR02234 family)
VTRRSSVWALLAAAVAVLATTAPVWLYGQTSSAVAAHVTITVVGGRAAPGVAAGGLVIAAAAVAAALARRVGAVVAAGVAALGGALVVVSALGAAGRAAEVLASAAAEQEGVSAIGAVTVSPWPWVAAAVGAAAFALGVATAVMASRWRGPSSRHEATTASTPGPRAEQGQVGPASERVDPGDAWDALSRGEDPT